MAYNYVDAVKDSILDFIATEEFDLTQFEDRDDAYQELNDLLWDNDSVTGNGSGSYTYDREEAKKYLFDSADGMSLLKDAVSEFGIEAETIAEKMMEEDWEWFDVTIRCYALGEALDEALNEVWEDNEE